MDSQPIQPELDAIAQIKSAKELTPLVARLQLIYDRYSYNSSILFSAGSTQDPDDSEHVIADVDQGGLGMPDRDYYTKDDAKSKETREHYLQHVQNVFELLGDSPAVAKQNAETVMRLETAMAKASFTRVDRRDPHKLVHKMKVADLIQLAPNFDWIAYYREMQYPETSHSQRRRCSGVHQGTQYTPGFRITRELEDPTSASTWPTLSSPYLSSKFVEENFALLPPVPTGRKREQPRWKRCVQYVDYDLGEALGQVYVAKVFSPELKQSTLDMVRRIEDAMGAAHPRARLDEPGNQAAGAGQSWRESATKLDTLINGATTAR